MKTSKIAAILGAISLLAAQPAMAQPRVRPGNAQTVGTYQAVTTQQGCIVYLYHEFYSMLAFGFPPRTPPINTSFSWTGPCEAGQPASGTGEFNALPTGHPSRVSMVGGYMDGTVTFSDGSTEQVHMGCFSIYPRCTPGVASAPRVAQAAPPQAPPAAIPAQPRVAAMPQQRSALPPVADTASRNPGSEIAAEEPPPQRVPVDANGKTSFPVPDNNECLTLDPNPENPFAKSSTIVGFVNNCGMPIRWQVCMFNERLARWECGSGTAQNGEHFNRRIQLTDTPGTARWLKAGCSLASQKASSGGNCGGDPNSNTSLFGAGH